MLLMNQMNGNWSCMMTIPSISDSRNWRSLVARSAWRWRLRRSEHTQPRQISIRRVRRRRSRDLVSRRRWRLFRWRRKMFKDWKRNRPQGRGRRWISGSLRRRRTYNYNCKHARPGSRQNSAVKRAMKPRPTLASQKDYLLRAMNMKTKEAYNPALAKIDGQLTAGTLKLVFKWYILAQGPILKSHW